MSVNLKNIFSVLIPALIILGAFYAGAVLYPLVFVRSQGRLAAVTVKEFGPLIQQGVQKDLILTTGKNEKTITSQELKKWIESYKRSYSGKQDLRISATMITSYLESLTPYLDSEPVDAKLQFHDSRAKIFTPSISGKKINIGSSSALITSAILDNKPSTSLVFDTVEPKITLDKINNLGINTLLGLGESDYGKSPSSRIFNIKLGMARFNGIILKPGEEFSFNKFLGEVDEKSGYRAELVIKSGRLISEYGGGLCQVATTFFRAAILSGLPIIERKPHSFSVQYYNPQGFDATIYPGVTDLRFLNDTPAHILIQAKVTGSKLMVEIYGSSDGRKVEMDGPHQYDKKPSGAMKAYFTRKISRDDKLVEEKRFDSIYKAPPAHPVERNPLE
ncbi:MAG: VanW family protein [Candidatus Yanofskybacteria bacterium]|nr:VanW family protein [Candidatus Yanofskybacteria bacterium]